METFNAVRILQTSSILLSSIFILSEGFGGLFLG